MGRAYQAIVFDFDGTLADTLEAARLVVNELADEFGFKRVEAADIPEMRQLSVSQILKNLGISKLKVPSLLAKGTKRLKSRIEQISMIDGMKDALMEVREMTDSLGILTSNSEENVHLFLRAHGLDDMVDFIVTSSKLSGKSKYLRRICKQHANEDGGVIYIGDEQRDVEASQKVGIPVIAVTWGFNSRESLAKHDPDYIVDDASELLAVLRDSL